MAHGCLEELLEFLIVLNESRPVRSEESDSRRLDLDSHVGTSCQEFYFSEISAYV